MRVQLALNVVDLEKAIEFYSKLFDVTPAKRRPGYANFVVEDPPLKLVLFEVPDASERLNHLGVEVAHSEELETAMERLRASGLAESVEDASTCCYATQDKVWAVEPEGIRWEWYRVLEDSPTFGSARAPDSPTEPRACC